MKLATDDIMVIGALVGAAALIAYVAIVLPVALGII